MLRREKKGQKTEKEKERKRKKGKIARSRPP